MTGTEVKAPISQGAQTKSGILRGQNVSGRSWKKVAAKRASSLRKTAINNQTKTWEQRRAEKLQRKEVLELQKQLKDERVQAIRDKNERRLENERRRAENEYEHSKKQAQNLNTSKLKTTLKSMSKKQLRQIKKTRVNNKTGAVEFVPAYSKFPDICIHRDIKCGRRLDGTGKMEWEPTKGLGGQVRRKPMMAFSVSEKV